MDVDGEGLFTAAGVKRRRSHSRHGVDVDGVEPVDDRRHLVPPDRLVKVPPVQDVRDALALQLERRVRADEHDLFTAAGVKGRRSRLERRGRPTSVTVQAAPTMKRYWAGASAMSVATASAHRPSHAADSTQLRQLSSAAVPP